MEIGPKTLTDDAAIQLAVASAMPNPLVKLIAERVVMPGLLKESRTLALMKVAREAGVSLRYLQVKIGLVRTLVEDAEMVLRSAASAYQSAHTTQGLNEGSEPAESKALRA